MTDREAKLAAEIEWLRATMRCEHGVDGSQPEGWQWCDGWGGWVRTLGEHMQARTEQVAVGRSLAWLVSVVDLDTDATVDSGVSEAWVLHAMTAFDALGGEE